MSNYVNSDKTEEFKKNAGLHISKGKKIFNSNLEGFEFNYLRRTKKETE
jgi:hypothetical protein